MQRENPIRKILLTNATSLKERKDLITMEASEQEKVDNVMVTKLYQLAINKSNIDFDQIPDSKGDITKFVGYTTMTECLSVVKELARQQGVKIKELDITETAINNIVLFKAQFVKGFLIDKDLIIMMYNLLVSACVTSTSVILASYVDFVKSPNVVEFTIQKDPTILSHTAIDSLEKFNESVRSGDFARIMNTVSNDKENFLGGAEIVIPFMIIGGLLAIVPLLRELTYYFYYSRMKISDSLKYQAELLEINKESVKYSNLPPSKKKQVLAKQARVAKNFKNMSEKIAIDSASTEKQVKQEIERENRNINVSEVKSQASTISTSSSDTSGGFIL